jgi:hypothetical protein
LQEPRRVDLYSFSRIADGYWKESFLFALTSFTEKQQQQR